MEPEREQDEDENAAGSVVNDDRVNNVSPLSSLLDKNDVQQKESNTNVSGSLPKTLAFREVGPTDLETCFAMEKCSYPANEAATKSTLQYRQHHAAKYFRCATVKQEDEADCNNHNDQDEQVIGFICSTRCHEFTAESMTQHSTSGPLLAIHSVVVRPDYQRRGIATAMLQDYIAFIIQQQQEQQQQQKDTSTTVTTESAPSSFAGSGLIRSSSNNSLSKMSSTNNAAKPSKPPIEKIVLLSKQNLLTFYIHAGTFSVIRPSPIVHGSETWYELERVLPAAKSNGEARHRRPCCYVVDAFCDTQRRGTGNPAAIVVLDETTNITIPPAAAAAAADGTLTVETARWMQTVAQEFNLAETAFVWPVLVTTATKGHDDDDDDNKDYKEEAHYYIRYFTPTMEVNLCGHATLAAASILFQFSGVKNYSTITTATTAAAAAVAPDATIVFHARHDLLRANLAPSSDTANAAAAAADGTSRPTRIAMEFPSKPAVEITNEDDIAAIKAMLKSAFDIHCHPEHEEDDYSEDEGEETSNIRFLGLAPPDIGDLLVELTPACFQQVLGGSTRSRRQQNQRSPPTSIQTNTAMTSGTSSSSSIIVSSDDEQDEVVQRPIRYNELLNWDGYSRGVILCCEAPWYHESSITADDNNPNGSSQSGDTNNIDINAAATPQADFQSRFFAPKAGIDEDPVTGSAHCVLAPHFFQRLHHKKSITRTTLIGHQQSPRGGFVECSMIYAAATSENAQESSSLNGGGPAQGEDGDEEEQRQQKQDASASTTGDRVRITGTTVVTLVGELY